MLELLNDYSYDQITITMSTEKVPIARQGFYKFYEGKKDLCFQMYNYPVLWYGRRDGKTIS